MPVRSKRYQALLSLLEPGRSYELSEAVEILKKGASAKFDETVELSVRLGIDPKKAEQAIRGTLSLPHGIGKERRVAVLAKGEQAMEARGAGADFVGDKDLIDRIAQGWTDFHVLIATPDMMKEVTRLGKILGPRGLMPSPKTGTVSPTVAPLVRQFKAGKLSFKNDTYGILHLPVGKVHFSSTQLEENIRSALRTIQRLKPPSAKGIFLLSAHLCTTMGPSIKLNLAKI